MDALPVFYQVIIDVIPKLLTFAAVWFAGRQAYLLKKDIMVKNNRASIEKAVELSKFYADTILYDMSLLFKVYEKTGLSKICNSIDLSLMSNFDKIEQSEIVDPKLIKDYFDLQEKISPEDLIESFKITSSTVYSFDESLFEKYSCANEFEKKEIAKRIKSEFYIIKGRLLNNLEYFAMSFNDGVADEATVYQSLHQTYIKIAKFLYIDISNINRSECDKFYTHFIDMFNRWHSLFLENYQEECLKENEIREKIEQFKSDSRNISKRRKRR